ncbi:MAG: TMEM165/GDT1 family protein [Gammaproteobacteria bacterium]|nr:TMEM165/GDT1 family protein [Gammaproteobacteria bacterium]
MEGFLVATGLVALAEIGDKTQLLAFVLAVRFRRPVPIVAGILVATLANHGVAAGFGVWLAALVPPDALRWLLGLSFIAMAAWVLVPDELEANGPQAASRGAFAATVVAFFLAEMGDKTQVATVALAAEYIEIVPVLAGTTLGMMIANVPAVYLGERCSHRVPMKLMRGAAAASFVLFGVAVLLGAGS